VTGEPSHEAAEIATGLSVAVTHDAHNGWRSPIGDDQDNHGWTAAFSDPRGCPWHDADAPHSSAPPFPASALAVPFCELLFHVSALAVPFF
jgi:hypothetical protein